VVTIAVDGIDHIYITVSDIDRAERFYDGVMRLLDFRKGTRPIAGEKHCHYFNQVMQYSIRPARPSARGHDPYGPGLHHLCFRVGSNAEVEAAARGLQALGIPATQPHYYPEYSDDYYATFFSDPDGIRLEIVAMREMRRLIRDNWDKLTEFVDPVAKAGLLK
jgi:glyoxylase I family protein